VKRTDELMSMARVAIYPVDARGLIGLPVGDASKVEYGTVHVNGGPSQDDQFLWDNFAEHNTMEQIARDTGGKAFYNTNGVGEASGGAIANGSNYYTLGYVPENKNYNGAFRKIRVRVADEHYSLQFRQGYYADSVAEEAKRLPTQIDPVVSAMQPGAPPLSQLIFEASVTAVGAAEAQGKQAHLESAGALTKALKPPLTRYSVDYSIDPRLLGSVTLPNGQKATDLELTQVAYDLDGLRLNYTDKVIAVPVRSEEQDGRELGIHLHQEIDLPPGKVLLRLGVTDMASGHIGTLQIPLTIPRS
jgi:hypothetical protein